VSACIHYSTIAGSLSACKCLQALTDSTIELSNVYKHSLTLLLYSLMFTSTH
jgi:hypothetical protein